jgi:hypothetical protein
MRITWRFGRSVRSKPRQVNTGIDSELLEDVAHMRMDGVRGDEELVGDLPVGASICRKIGDHSLGFGQCLPPGRWPIDFDGSPSHAETAKPAPNTRSVPARPDAHRYRQRLVERGDCRRVVAVLRQHPAEVFERGSVGKRARSASIERNRAL